MKSVAFSPLSRLLKSRSTATEKDVTAVPFCVRRSAEVVADNIYFGDSKRDSQSGGDYAPPAYGSPAESYTAPASGGFAEIEEDGELPF